MIDKKDFSNLSNEEQCHCESYKYRYDDLSTSEMHQISRCYKGNIPKKCQNQKCIHKIKKARNINSSTCLSVACLISLLGGGGILFDGNAMSSIWFFILLIFASQFYGIDGEPFCDIMSSSRYQVHPKKIYF